MKQNKENIQKAIDVLNRVDKEKFDMKEWYSDISQKTYK